MSLRQRVPFKFAEHAEDDERILDEQEQEELIESLRKQSDVAITQYMYFLQISLALSCILHIIFLLQHPKQSPIIALFSSPPDTSPYTIPLPALFGLLHVLLHINLALTLLPPAHRFRRTLATLPPPFRALPLAPTHPAALCAAALAPTLSFLLECGWADTAWWALAGGMTALVYAVQAWIAQDEEGLRGLEGLRYDARGA